MEQRALHHGEHWVLQAVASLRGKDTSAAKRVKYSLCCRSHDAYGFMFCFHNLQDDLAFFFFFGKVMTFAKFCKLVV